MTAHCSAPGRILGGYATNFSICDSKKIVVYSLANSGTRYLAVHGCKGGDEGP
jgi:hypothetical protein